MHHARPIALVLLACTLAAPAPTRAAGPEMYSLDPVHTRVMVAVSHAGFSRAMGTVSGSTGTLLFDPDDWRSARLDVTVPVAALDFGDAKWNAATLAANLLDGERHPQARFVSDTVEPVDATHARVCGQLTLREATRPLCMDVVLNALKRHPLPPFRRTAGFSATALLSRSDYGISAWKSVIGDAVELQIEVEAVRNGAAPSAPDDGKPAPVSSTSDLAPDITPEPPRDPPPAPSEPVTDPEP